MDATGKGKLAVGRFFTALISLERQLTVGGTAVCGLVGDDGVVHATINDIDD